MALGIHEAQSGTEPSSSHLPRFDVVRKGVYAGLLLFVVIVGLPMVTIPSLRSRLSERIFELKAAISGYVRPAVAQVGANLEGFPKEYETPVPSAPDPFPSGITEERKGYTLIAPGLIALEPRRTPKPLKIPETPPEETRSEPLPKLKPQPVPDVSEKPEPEVQFQQGSDEKAAYDLLIQSNASISDLVRGSKPSLHFFTWDAVHKGGDVYWVRLRFRSEGSSGELDYIWEVKLESGKVVPLSYNAKNLE